MTRHLPSAPPDLTLAGLQLWVHGYELPDLVDDWDGNWLRVTAHAGGAGASVRVSGAILDTRSFARFREGLAALHAALAGNTRLESHEPHLVVHVAPVDRVGHLGARVEITPELATQRHEFRFDLDQSWLPSLVAQCDAILARFPVRGGADPARA